MTNQIGTETPDPDTLKADGKHLLTGISSREVPINLIGDVIDFTLLLFRIDPLWSSWDCPGKIL